MKTAFDISMALAAGASLVVMLSSIRRAASREAGARRSGWLEIAWTLVPIVMLALLWIALVPRAHA